MSRETEKVYFCRAVAVALYTNLIYIAPITPRYKSSCYSMCQNKLPVKIGERISPYSGKNYPIYEYVACRKCEECVTNRRNQWAFRVLQQTESCYNTKFLTLTYNDEHLPECGVKVRDIQLWTKRMRKNISLWYPSFDTEKYPMKYFLCSEYGSKRKRPHYHLILWNCPMTDDQIEKTWKNGFIEVGDTCHASVQYCLKYFAIKDKNPEGKLKNFCLMSKNIGENWLADNLSYVKSYVYMPGERYKIPIPTYYRKKLNYPKREYDWLYEPDPYERFSPKFLRSRGLLSRRAFKAAINSSPDKINTILDDAENYYLYRDEIFHQKYDKCNTKDNQ